MFFNKNRVPSAATEGFDTECPGTGKYIQHQAVIHIRCEDIKNGFSYPIGGRADLSLDPGQTPALEAASNNSQRVTAGPT